MQEKWVDFDTKNSQKRDNFHPIWTRFGPGSGPRVRVPDPGLDALDQPPFPACSTFTLAVSAVLVLQMISEATKEKGILHPNPFFFFV